MMFLVPAVCFAFLFRVHHARCEWDMASLCLFFAVLSAGMFLVQIEIELITVLLMVIAS